MTHVHSTREQVELQDMVDLTRLLIALMTEESC
jgi:tripeptide aminopeptidase